MPGYPDWSGIPLVTGDLTVLNESNVVVGNDSSVTYEATAIRPAYYFRFVCWNSTNNTTPIPVLILIQWQDMATGENVDKEAWYVYAGTAATPHVIRGSGPTAGDTMFVQVFNLSGSAVNLEFDLTVIEANRQVSRHDLRSDTNVGIAAAGFTMAPCDMQANVVSAVAGQAVGASSTVSLLLPLVAGPCYAQLNSTGAAGTGYIQVENGPDTQINTGQLFAEILAPSGATVQPYRFALPRVQSVLVLGNTSASSANLTAGIVCETT